MKREKTIRKIAYIVMAMMLAISTVFTGVGTMGVMEAKADEDDQQITELNLNVDWSKLPSLTVGTKIGDLTSIPYGTVATDSSEVDSDNMELNWAIELKPEFLEKNYISETDYNVCSSIYNNLAPVSFLDQEYAISDSDTFYGYVYVDAESGYKFADNQGENISGIIKSNASGAFALTQTDSMVVVFLRLGTPSEIENNKNNGSSSGGNSDQQITELKVNVDWSKIPDLTVGTAIGAGATNLEEIPDGTVTINSSEVEDSISYNWAIQLKPEFVEKNYLSQEYYDNYSEYNYLAPMFLLKGEYEISENDTYYAFAVVYAKDGYKFADKGEVDVSNIIESNTSNLLAITDGTGNYIVIFLRLGTPSEIENNKNSGSSTIIKGNGYEFDTTTGTLTVTSNEGTTAWHDDEMFKNHQYSKIKSLVIQDGVTAIGDEAFNCCSSITEAKIPSSVTSIGMNAFNACEALTSIEIPDGITEISFSAFSNCKSITTIKIPESVTEIGGLAFQGTKIESIVIPKNVSYIGDGAFYECPELKEVKMESTSPATIGNDVFNGVYFVTNNEKGIKVPMASVSDYQSVWSDWKDYIEGYGTSGGGSGSGSAGNITPDAKVDADSPVKGAELTNSKEELLNASGIFTEAEKQQIANGSNAKVWLELDKVDLSQVSDTDKTAILAKAKDFMGEGTELTYFDASLFKQIDGQTAAKVSEPGISMKITIKIPTELLTTDANVNRTYTIIRLHDGQAEEITGEFDVASGSFTFLTDKFSTYAIAYKDTAKNNGGNGGNGGSNGGNQNNDDDNDDSSDNNNQTIVAGNTTNTPLTGASADAASNATASNGTAPKTGDSNAMMAWAVLAVVSLAGVVVFRKKRA